MLEWILPLISNGATYLSDLTRKLNGCVLRMASPLRHSTDANDVRRISSSCSVRARRKGKEEYRKSIWIKTIWTFEMHETCSNEWMNTLSSRSKQAKPGRHRPRHKRKENKFEYFLEGRQGRRRRCALEQIVNICLLESLFFHGSRSLVFPSPRWWWMYFCFVFSNSFTLPSLLKLIDSWRLFSRFSTRSTNNNKVQGERKTTPGMVQAENQCKFASWISAFALSLSLKNNKAACLLQSFSSLNKMIHMINARMERMGFPNPFFPSFGRSK